MSPSRADELADETTQQRKARLRRLRGEILKRKVAARVPEEFQGRWTRRQWAQASLFASMAALLGLLVPGLDKALSPNIQTQRASFALSLPDLHAQRSTLASGKFGDNWQAFNVRKGETASDLFKSLGIPASTLARLLKQPGVKMELSRMKPGTEISLDLPANGALRGVRYMRMGEAVELDLSGSKIIERAVPAEVDTRTVVLSGKIGDSLFQSARKAGLTAKNIEELTDDIFKYDVDFDSDLGENDRFSVVVEQTWKNGVLVNTSPVLAATINANGTLYSGFRFERDGKPSYFTADGRSLERPFIRMPIPYARLSSGFGGRHHPILGRFKMHKGVDYAAGTGTPIMAAGDARVKSVGWHGGYGKAVELDHGQGKTTFYAHMSRFGNVRPGQRIAQGTVIGYVGSTGLSTGPHLHYEFRVNGVHRNPLSITLPPPAPLDGAQLADFRNQTRKALAKIREVENVIYTDAETRVAAVAAQQGHQGDIAMAPQPAQTSGKGKKKRG